MTVTVKMIITVKFGEEAFGISGAYIHYGRIFMQFWALNTRMDLLWKKTKASLLKVHTQQQTEGRRTESYLQCYEASALINWLKTNPRNWICLFQLLYRRTKVAVAHADLL